MPILTPAMAADLASFRASCASLLGRSIDAIDYDWAEAWSNWMTPRQAVAEAIRY